MLAIPASAQTVLTGTVTDGTTNAPLPGVNLVIRGTTTGTVSDGDGKYTLQTQLRPPFTVGGVICGLPAQRPVYYQCYRGRLLI